MKFQEWADKLELVAGEYPEIENAIAISPWRCHGACGQLMYGLDREDNWSYPAPSTPVASIAAPKWRFSRGAL